MRLPLVLLLLLTASPLSAAECRVIDPELQGEYQGGCRKGLAHGEGVAKGTAEYRGAFRNGLKDGHGIKTWAWGDRYEGGFVGDRRQGTGSYLWGNGSPWAGERYEGDYVADLREGSGVYYWPNGDRFEGQWKADVRQGYSAMEQRRQAAANARAGAFAPGTLVCAPGKIGIAHEVMRVGMVETVDDSGLRVRLLEVEGRSGIVTSGGSQAGEVLRAPVSDWTPCLERPQPSNR